MSLRIVSVTKYMDSHPVTIFTKNTVAVVDVTVSVLNHQPTQAALAVFTMKLSCCCCVGVQQNMKPDMSSLKLPLSKIWGFGRRWC